MSNLFHDNDISKSGVQSPATDADTGYRKEDHPEQRESNDSGDSEKGNTAQPKHELSSADSLLSPSRVTGESTLFQGILLRIGTPDHDGWMRKKGGFYNTWKSRYFVLKGPRLYWLRSNSVFVSVTLADGCVLDPIVSDLTGDQGRGICQYHRLSHSPRREHQPREIWVQVGARRETRPLFQFEGQNGYPRMDNGPDENSNWLRLCKYVSSQYFILHNDPTHAHIDATGSLVNIPVIPLAVAQAMNPPPRPPSPTAQVEARQAVRREISSRIGSYRRSGSFFTRPEAGPSASPSTSAHIQAPVRPPRDMRRRGVEPEVRSLTPSHLRIHPHGYSSLP
jgi:hypothetical protein